MSEKNKLSLTVQYADVSLRDTLTRPLLRRWVNAALFAPAELTLRFVDADEGRMLNHTYRGKDYATNVLTFAYDADGNSDGESGDTSDDLSTVTDVEPTRADLVFCTPVLEREASEQGKSIVAHAAHLVVHGVLHAQGYDHEDDADATEMESLEVEILGELGFADPYRGDSLA